MLPRLFPQALKPLLQGREFHRWQWFKPYSVQQTKMTLIALQHAWLI